MRRRLSALLVIVIFIGGVLAYVLTRPVDGTTGTFSGPPFVITYTHYKVSSPERTRIATTAVNSAGFALSTMYREDGEALHQAAEQYSSERWAAWTDQNAYSRSKHVVRTEEILGLTAYFYSNDVGEGRTIETGYAPETGPILLKQVVKYATGETEITQATKLELREITEWESSTRSDLLLNLKRR